MLSFELLLYGTAQAPEDMRPDVLAYQRLEFLTQAIKNELQRDLQINDAGVLPPDVVLPQITAAEYGRVMAITKPVASELANFCYGSSLAMPC